MKSSSRELRNGVSPRFRAIVAGVLFLLLVVVAILEIGARRATAFANVDPNNQPVSKITQEVSKTLANGGRASVVIFLTDQADVSDAYTIKDHDERGWYVYNTLTEHATRAQVDLKSFLTSRGVEFQSFWVANMLIATVDQELAEEIASRADVLRISANKPARWIEDPEIADFREAPERPDVPNVAEPGVTNVNAPAVWALGFTGQNMVIGNQDTGIRWTHNAIKPKYRGWNGATADHNFNWHDSIHSGGGSCGANTTVPCDDNGHGTHTTGTSAGDDGTGNQVGVAPGAKWIGCRNMDQGNGTPATYSECFQFFIAPTDLAGNNANPALRPHVMNNSWGCPPSEGCNTGAELETIVNNTQAAGIFVVVSAGNAGPSCSSVLDAPAIYNASFSVGSISPTSNNLSSFSSRGPSLFYNPNLLKPNLSAPGSNIRSSTRTSDTSYGNSSGTSMAGPHVAGVVALLWSARPQLVRDIAATKTLLQNTANPNVNITTGTQTCGGTPSTQIPNNSFGYGRIDALAAVNAAGSTPTSTPTHTATATPTNTPPPSISGTIIYGNAIGSPATRPVPNVDVNGAGSPIVATVTGSSGTYFLSGFGSGSYTVTPLKSGEQNGAISSFDAARISQFVVGTTTLNSTQQAVADVSGNGSLSSFDAAQIGRYAVSQPNSGSSGTWRFSPVSRSYASVTSNINGEDFSAVLMGDVTGNWTSAGARFVSFNGPERAAAIKAPVLATKPGKAVVVPVTIDGAVSKGIIGYEFDLRFDPLVIQPQPMPVDLAGTVGRGFSVAVNALEPGLLRVAVYGPMPINDDGVLLNLRFTAIGEYGSVSPLIWERILLNEGSSVVSSDGQVMLSSVAGRQ